MVGESASGAKGACKGEREHPAPGVSCISPRGEGLAAKRALALLYIPSTARRRGVRRSPGPAAFALARRRPDPL